MKVGQKSLVRWMSKWSTKGPATQAKTSVRSPLRELGREELRQVTGGDGGSSTSPNKGW